MATPWIVAHGEVTISGVKTDTKSPFHRRSRKDTPPTRSSKKLEFPTNCNDFIVDQRPSERWFPCGHGSANAESRTPGIGSTRIPPLFRGSLRDLASPLGAQGIGSGRAALASASALAGVDIRLRSSMTTTTTSPPGRFSPFGPFPDRAGVRIQARREADRPVGTRLDDRCPHVRTRLRSSLVQVLSTGNRAATHRVSEHMLAAWHDLNHLATGPEALTFVSLFDDTADVWADEDLRLVESLSTVSRWSRPDEFAAVLSGTA